MILNDYNKIINENFDLMDTETRQFIVSLKEDSEQSQILSALSSALYDKIVEKVDDIDFGTIPRSRGDITKVDGFDNTYECLRIMRRLIEEYRQDPTIVDNVINAIENIKERKGIFMKAYALNIEFPITFYNLMVATIENSVSFLITVCIQYIKDPESNDITTALDKVAYNNAKSNMLYEQILKFNNICNDKSLDKSLDYVIKTSKKISEAYDCGVAFDGIDPRISVRGINRCEEDDDTCIPSPYTNLNRNPFEDPKDVPDPNSEPLHEEEPTDNTGYEVEPGFAPSLDNASADDYELDRRDVANEFVGTVIGGVALAAGAAAGVMFALKGLVTVVIPMLRNITYYLVSRYAKIGACLEIQSNFIEMNAYKLKNSDYQTKNTDNVVKKQLKVAEKLKKWSNKFAIEDKKAEKHAREMIRKEGNNKIKISDLQGEISVDSYNKSLLF